MVCYILPTAAALMIYAHRKKGGRNDEEGKQLNLLLAGGAVGGRVHPGDMVDPALTKLDRAQQ